MSALVFKIRESNILKKWSLNKNLQMEKDTQNICYKKLVVRKNQVVKISKYSEQRHNFQVTIEFILLSGKWAYKSIINFFSNWPCFFPGQRVMIMRPTLALSPKLFNSDYDIKHFWHISISTSFLSILMDCIFSLLYICYLP